PVSVLLQADFDRAFGETAAVGRDPYRHRTVPFAYDAVERNGDGTHGGGCADHECRKHSRPQLIAWVLHFGADQHTTRGRVDHRADGGNPPVEYAIRKSIDLDLDLLSHLESRAIVLGDVR